MSPSHYHSKIVESKQSNKHTPNVKSSWLRIEDLDSFKTKYDYLTSNIPEYSIYLISIKEVI